MLEVPVIRNNSDTIISRLRKRNINADELIHRVIELDDQRRATQKELDDLLAEGNKLSKQIGDLFKAGKQEDANALKEQTVTLKERSQDLKERMSKVEEELKDLLYQIPNAPATEVPEGKTPEDNQVVEEVGVIPEFSKESLPHWELASKYKLIDFELGVKISGAGFPVYEGKGAKLQRALINFFLDEAEKAGYKEVIPPHLVNEASGFGTGQLPDKEGQMYHVTADNLYLIPTAEVPVTNIFRDVILDEDQLPVRMCAYTPCFRREAGSYGKDVRGLNRLHQFDKVEIVQVVHPDKSYQVLTEMVEHVKKLLVKLGLPFRLLKLCGGDMGFTSALTYDLEVFSAAQKRWLEVSSVSNFETYQANRLKCRMRNREEKKMQLVHTLNGSALALPRILAAILENNQTPDGIKIPEVLWNYTGFKIIS